MQISIAGGNSRWIPSRPFAPGDDGAWFDPSVISTMLATGGAVPVTAVGQALGGFVDRSGKGNDAAQTTAANQPLYARVPQGGVRNLLANNSEFALATWVKTNVTVTTGAIAAPLGTGLADLITKTGADGTTPAQTFAVAPGAYAFSVYALQAAGSNWLRMRIDLVFQGGGSANAWFNLATGASGTTNGGLSIVGVDNIGGGWYRVKGTITFTGSGNTVLGLSPVGADNSLPGTGSVYLWGAQAETGSTVTALQSVTSGRADITEIGKSDRYCALFDQINDVMPVVLPAGTYTVAHGNEAGVTITTGVVHGGGAYNLPAPTRAFGYVAINRALTAGETTSLTAYLNSRRP